MKWLIQLFTRRKPEQVQSSYLSLLDAETISFHNMTVTDWYGMNTPSKTECRVQYLNHVWGK